MGRIPDASIREIRSRVDIVDLVSRYVQLKKAGRNHTGLCPFHDEKTASFNVSPERQTFHCFGCQVGGDVFEFLTLHDNLTFPEAARSLARECGVEIPEESGDAEARGISERVFEANEIAQRVYVDQLASAEGEEARNYLARRGISDEDRRELGLGFAPDRWDTVTRALAQKKVEGSLGEQAGLLAPRKSGDGHYDRLRGRVTFPIYDVRRRIVGFGGRALGNDDGPKYLNTTESPVFRKRESFYGFPWALESIRRSRRAIVCEGYFDRIALHRAGIGEGLATCGTALTQEHGRNLRRRTQTAVLLFDGDQAGRNAMEKALEVLLPEGLRVRGALLPDGQDPDDFLTSKGPEALRALVDDAPDALELVIRRAVTAGVNTPAEKADAVAHVAPLLAVVADTVEREAYVRRLALATDSGEAAVAAIVRSTRQGRSATPEEAALSAPKPRREGPEERQLALLCHVLLRHPTLATPDLRGRIEASVPDDSWRRLALALVEAAAGGDVDADGAIDHFVLADRLEAEERTLLHATAAGAEALDPGARPELVAFDVLNWFERRGRARTRRQTTQRLREAGASQDPTALLAEKQRELDARRARAAAAKAAGVAQ